MNKKQLTEQEIRTRYITPAIQAAGWKPQQIREEVTFTAGRIIVRGTLSMRSQETQARRLPPALQAQHPLGIWSKRRTTTTP